MALRTTNISITYVKNALTAVFSNIGSLCTHANINKWSKKKPVRGMWPLSADGQSGLDFLNGWAYNRPRGLAFNEPYRLGDFRGYKHEALPPFELAFYPSATLEDITDLSFILAVSEVDLTVSDLMLDDWYFGVKIDNTYYTAPYPLSERFSQEIALAVYVEVAAGSHVWEAFLSPAPAGPAFPGNEPSGRIVLPPYTGYVTSGTVVVTINVAQVLAIVNATINGDLGVYVNGSYIQFTGLNYDLTDFWFVMYHHETGNLLGADYISASLDGIEPGTRVGVVPNISPPSGGATVTIRFETN